MRVKDDSFHIPLKHCVYGSFCCSKSAILKLSVKLLIRFCGNCFITGISKLAKVTLWMGSFWV